MAITPNTNFVAGSILTAQQQNNFGRGIMNYSGLNAGVSNLTTTNSDITGASLAFTGETGRLYKATWTISGIKNTSAGYVEVSFTTSTNTQIAAIDTNAIAGGFWNLSGSALFTASGAVTYKLRGVVQNDTASPTASATVPIFFMIEDIGHI